MLVVNVFENTRKEMGGRGPLGPSPKSAYVKEQCDEDFAVLVQFYAKIITLKL